MVCGRGAVSLFRLHKGLMTISTVAHFMSAINLTDWNWVVLWASVLALSWSSWSYLQDASTHVFLVSCDLIVGSYLRSAVLIILINILKLTTWCHDHVLAENCVAVTLLHLQVLGRASDPILIIASWPIDSIFIDRFRHRSRVECWQFALIMVLV